MVGIVFYFEKNDVDVWSGRKTDLDAWNYAAKAAGDINKLIVIDCVGINFDIGSQFEVVDNMPELQGNIVKVCCPWDKAANCTSLWDFDHKVDWYIFGPAQGWSGVINEPSIIVPQAGRVALHSTHIASIVLLHRYKTIYGVTNG